MLIVKKAGAKEKTNVAWLYASIGILIMTGIYLWAIEIDEHANRNKPITIWEKDFEFSIDSIVVRGYTNNNVCEIHDSFRVTNEDDMRYILSCVKDNSMPEEEIYNIDIDDMIAEWKAHNLMYKLHIFQGHTRDVDFKRNKLHTKLFYKTLSLFY